LEFRTGSHKKNKQTNAKLKPPCQAAGVVWLSIWWEEEWQEDASTAARAWVS
jgi:hypothetical protein